METALTVSTAENSQRQPVTGEELKKLDYAVSRRTWGWKQHLVRKLIWANIFFIALRVYKNPLTAFKRLRALKSLRAKYRDGQTLGKYAVSGRRYFVNYNTPGWPSSAFSRYVRHHLQKVSSKPALSLATLVFAITKKCGFQCEHCCEWNNLNQPENLSADDLLLIIYRFHQLGISQIQLSGGEPLNRIKDIQFILENAPAGIDFWIYTSGFNLTAARARLLREKGLTGITVSLDHYLPDKHDEFRGVKNSFARAIQAAEVARQSGLLTCFSICATRQFITRENLERYLDLARSAGVSFVQILEPKAVGRYAGNDVGLLPEHKEVLEEIYHRYNYDQRYRDYPSISYYAHLNRQFGCAGSAVDYVYADTDGDIHNCPFCQRKLFSAFDDSLPEMIAGMKAQGCGAISHSLTEIQQL